MVFVLCWAHYVCVDIDQPFWIRMNCDKNDKVCRWIFACFFWHSTLCRIGKCTVILDCVWHTMSTWIWINRARLANVLWRKWYIVGQLFLNCVWHIISMWVMINRTSENSYWTIQSILNHSPRKYYSYVQSTHSIAQKCQISDIWFLRTIVPDSTLSILNHSEAFGGLLASINRVPS